VCVCVCACACGRVRVYYVKECCFCCFGWVFFTL